jgi:hypothetical protein
MSNDSPMMRLNAWTARNHDTLSRNSELKMRPQRIKAKGRSNQIKSAVSKSLADVCFLWCLSVAQACWRREAKVGLVQVRARSNSS